MSKRLFFPLLRLVSSLVLCSALCSRSLSVFAPLVSSADTLLWSPLNRVGFSGTARNHIIPKALLKVFAHMHWKENVTTTKVLSEVQMMIAKTAWQAWRTRCDAFANQGHQEQT